MKELKFDLAVCTSIEQSQRLLTLGLKPETADMSYYILDYEPVLTIGMAQVYRETIKGGKIIEKQNAEVIPAWSLHRLIELYSDVEDTSSLCIKDVSYKLLIFCIEKAIHCGFFNKEYLKQ